MARPCVCVRLQSGELPILGDQPEQGGLAARPSERWETPGPLRTAASRATPRPKRKRHGAELLDAGAPRGSRGVPEQVRTLAYARARLTVRGKSSVDALWKAANTPGRTRRRCFTCSSNFAARIWEQDVCVARKPGAEEAAERPGSKSQPEPPGGGSEQSHNGPRPKRCSRNTSNGVVLIVSRHKARVRGGMSNFFFPFSRCPVQDGARSQIPEDALCERGDWRWQRCVGM